MRIIRMPYEQDLSAFMIEFSTSDLNLCDHELITKFRNLPECTPMSKRLHLLACWCLSIENERRVLADKTPSDKVRKHGLT